jgi:corrinoid protein of di/trimethylamine methyltransferase
MSTNTEQQLLEALTAAVLEYDVERVQTLTQQVVAEGYDPLRALEDGLGRGLRRVGVLFGRREAFLPELVIAGEAMKVGLAILEPELRAGQVARSGRGTFLIGTVAGDIHDIGKVIVSALLIADGFNVIDLGVDVPTPTFIAAVQQHHPDILGLSALLSTTIPMQGKVIEALQQAGLRDRVKVMIGGAAVTPTWADQIGADAYAKDAVEAVQLAKHLLARSDPR